MQISHSSGDSLREIFWVRLKHNRIRCRLQSVVFGRSPQVKSAILHFLNCLKTRIQFVRAGTWLRKLRQLTHLWKKTTIRKQLRSSWTSHGRTSVSISDDRTRSGNCFQRSLSLTIIPLLTQTPRLFTIGWLLRLRSCHPLVTRWEFPRIVPIFLNNHLVFIWLNKPWWRNRGFQDINGIVISNSNPGCLFTSWFRKNVKVF